MLIDYFDRNFMRGCIPYTAVDGVIEEQSGHGTIVTPKMNIKTSMDYIELREVYEKAIMSDMEMMVDIDEDDETL